MSLKYVLTKCQISHLRIPQSVGFANHFTVNLLGRAHNHMAAMLEVMEWHIPIENRNAGYKLAQLLFDARIHNW